MSGDYDLEDHVDSPEEGKKKKPKVRENELYDLDQVMRSEAGKRVLSRLMRYTGLIETVFDEDARRHAFNEGKRDVGLWFHQEMKEANSDMAYIILLKE